MTAAGRKRQYESLEQEKLPMCHLFLNFISADDVKKWKDEIVVSKGYVKLINSRHLCWKISIEGLKSLTSIVKYDGRFLADWMECEVREERLKNPPKSHDKVHSSKNGGKYPSISDKFAQFCATNGCNDVTVSHHHITIRSMLKSLPLFSNKGGADNGSHMCDTIDCISEHHVLVETREVNDSRRLCPGVLVQIHRNNAGVGYVTRIIPCDHGKKLQYSCRKIRTVITEDKHVPLYK